MSPPMVKLASKEPLQNVVSDEKLPEKWDNLDLGPAVVTVETNRRALSQRQQCQRQRTRRLACGIFLIIFVAMAALGTMALVHRLRRHHRSRWSCGNNYGKMPEHVTVDHHNRLISVHHDHDKDANTNAMEILHEYNRKLVAYKDTDLKICYIDRLDETFEAGYERWESYETKGRTEGKTLKVISQPIEIDVVKHVLDKHITLHCHDSRSVWVMEIDEKEVTSTMEVIHV